MSAVSHIVTRATGRPSSSARSKDQPARCVRRSDCCRADEHRLAELLQRRDQRIVVAQQHLVIELAIDPALDDALDVAEVADHVAAVERAGAHFDFGDRVVAVRMLADAVVVEQPMAVTEIDALGDRIHDNVNYMSTAVLPPADWTAPYCWPMKHSRGDVQPIYVGVGLAWKLPSARVVERLIAASPFVATAGDRLAALSVDMRDVYAANHWAVERPAAVLSHARRGRTCLDAMSSLFGKAGVFCAAAAIGRLLIGTLEHNPFPTPLLCFGRRCSARSRWASGTN